MCNNFNSENIIHYGKKKAVTIFKNIHLKLWYVCDMNIDNFFGDACLQTNH